MEKAASGQEENDRLPVALWRNSILISWTVGTKVRFLSLSPFFTDGQCLHRFSQVFSPKSPSNAPYNRQSDHPSRGPTS